MFHFILSSEFSAYIKQIKVILSAVKKISFFSLVLNTIYTFSLQQTEVVSKILSLIFSEKIWNAVFLSDITLRMCARQIKKLTSHFDVTLSWRNADLSRRQFDGSFKRLSKIAIFFHMHSFK